MLNFCRARRGSDLRRHCIKMELRRVTSTPHHQICCIKRCTKHKKLQSPSLFTIQGQHRQGVLFISRKMATFDAINISETLLPANIIKQPSSSRITLYMSSFKVGLHMDILKRELGNEKTHLTRRSSRKFRWLLGDKETPFSRDILLWPCLFTILSAMVASVFRKHVGSAQLLIIHYRSESATRQGKACLKLPLHDRSWNSITSPVMQRSALWHESIAKIISWESFCVLLGLKCVFIS